MDRYATRTGLGLVAGFAVLVAALVALGPASPAHATGFMEIDARIECVGTDATLFFTVTSAPIAPPTGTGIPFDFIDQFVSMTEKDAGGALTITAPVDPPGIFSLTVANGWSTGEQSVVLDPSTTMVKIRTFPDNADWPGSNAFTGVPGCEPSDGTIIIHKLTFDAAGAHLGPGDGFAFNIGGPSSDSGSTSSSGVLTFADVPVGSYTVTEIGFGSGGWVNIGGGLRSVLSEGGCPESIPQQGLSSPLLDVPVAAGQTVVICWYDQQGQPPPPPEEIRLTIVKAVTTSNNGVAPPAGTLFEFDLDCIGSDVAFSLADGESRTVTFSGATKCSLTETNTQAADAVTGEFSGELISSNRTVTVVNNYEGVVVLGTAITKVLTSADPAAVGERVDFDVTVTFQGLMLPDAEFVDVYENEFLSFEGASDGTVSVACQRFAGTPDAAHDTVVCPVGDLSGPATLTMHFTAVKSTLGGRTINEAKVVSDLDGPGGDPPLMIGPAFDDVEIVEVLALPPLGDGAVGPQGGVSLALLAVLLAMTAATTATARRAVRGGALG